MHRRVAQKDVYTSGLTWHRLQTSCAATTIEEAQRGLSHQVRHRPRPASMRLKRPCRKLSFPATCQPPSPSALPSTRMESSRPRRRSRKLIDQISTIYCALDIQHVLGISVQTWPTQRSSPPRSQTSVRQALRCSRRPASTQTTHGPSKGPTCSARRDGRPLSPLLPSPLAPGPLSTSKILFSSPSRTKEASCSCLQFNELRPRCHNFQFLLNMEHTPSLSTNCCPTAAVETKQDEVSHFAKEISRNHQIPEFIVIGPFPTKTTTNSHSVSTQTNGCNYQLVGIIDPPEMCANCAWNRNPDVHNHIIRFTNSQQTVQRAPHTRQPKVFRSGNSDCHRVLNHSGSQP